MIWENENEERKKLIYLTDTKFHFLKIFFCFIYKHDIGGLNFYNKSSMW